MTETQQPERYAWIVPIPMPLWQETDLRTHIVDNNMDLWLERAARAGLLLSDTYVIRTWFTQAHTWVDKDGDEHYEEFPATQEHATMAYIRFEKTIVGRMP